MAQRVLGLLWGLTFAPGAPAEVAQSRTLSESLHHYASVDEVGTPLVWDYMKRCISQVCVPSALCPPDAMHAGHGTRTQTMTTMHSVDL